MDKLWLVLGVLACPLGMVAMGGVAWFAGKLGRGRTSTVAHAAETTDAAPTSAASDSGGVGSRLAAPDEGGTTTATPVAALSRMGCVGRQ